MVPNSLPEPIFYIDWRPAHRALLAVLFCMATLAAVPVREVLADTWAKRLGFPPNSKVVLLHVQELGMCHETNAAGTQLLQQGLVRSASAMAPCPWFTDAAQWCGEHPGTDVGLSLTISSEWPSYRWRPVAADDQVASLLDPDRFLWRSPTQVMVNATADDVERELMAQIDFARSQGMRPTHFTTHQGLLVIRPDLIEVYLRVARQQWIPAVVVELTPEQVVKFQQAGFPLPDNIIQLLSDYPLPKVDDLRMLPPAESYEVKKQAFLTMLHELPPGLTQIAINPAVESEALKRIAPDWQQRVWETQLMEDEAVRAALTSDGVIVTDWREVMDRFEGRPATADESASNATPSTP